MFCDKSKQNNSLIHHETYVKTKNQRFAHGAVYR